MDRPTRPATARYITGAEDDLPPDGRLFTPVFLRNGPPLIRALVPLLGGLSGPVLEIGSGTGQHAAACALAFPEIAWHPSDPIAVHRRSAMAWAAHLGAPERPALDIDAATDWPAQPEVRALGPLTAVVSMNVIHIAPLAVAEGLIAGAARALAPGGLLIFYGPFRENGVHTGAGNAAFDAGLRAENPDWGLRDLGEITAMARKAGFEAPQRTTMPANNLLIAFPRPL